MARRSAISRARAGARLVKRPATLAHATSNTASASVDNIAINVASGGSSAIRACSSVRTASRRFLSTSGYARSRSAAIVVSSACAAACVTPGRSRPLIWRFRASRASSEPVLGSLMRRGDIISGTKKSDRTYWSMPVNSDGATPITVSSLPLMRTRRPSTAGSDPNSCSHNARPSTTTASRPGT